MSLAVKSQKSLKGIYAFLKQLLNDLGLVISFEKLCASQMLVPCLGIVVDIINGTISIPADKLNVCAKLACKSKTNMNYISWRAYYCI